MGYRIKYLVLAIVESVAFYLHDYLFNIHAFLGNFLAKNLNIFLSVIGKLSVAIIGDKPIRKIVKLSAIIIGR